VDSTRSTRISKLLSLALRHNPSALGIELDRSGWAGVDGVLRGLAAQNEDVTLEELEEIVAESEKQRFALSPDGEMIRANQGHSIAVDLGLPPREPPEILHHGTVSRFLASILSEGLRRGARTHVHLSRDEETARVVGRRRRGDVIILRIRARTMHEAGYAFFMSDNGVWLTDHVPPDFLEPDRT
jgi:putative RNA 2'-phosphotransferase